MLPTSYHCVYMSAVHSATHYATLVGRYTFTNKCQNGGKLKMLFLFKVKQNGRFCDSDVISEFL